MKETLAGPPGRRYNKLTAVAERGGRLAKAVMGFVNTTGSRNFEIARESRNW